MEKIRILFQGDSITDAMRWRESDQYRGSGYATIVSAKLGYDHPDKYEFINRGISGNRVVDLLARIKCDTINLKPDVMSILIGINDVWHELSAQNGVDADIYEEYYRLLIKQIKAALPDIRIIILEPFLLKGSATAEKWEIFRPEAEKRAAISKKIAAEFGLDFVPLMKKFDDAVKIAPPEYWIMDGVHPTAAGHELIAREWIKVFNME
ncbi:MAG: SGNH/GDSL hydrolase family protein [Clostridia bacterium]|nr:SGNH/GDSL hydrolase family protein [Clostridia bacterium]